MDAARRAGSHPVSSALVYAAALTLTVYTIIYLEFQRLGIIRVDRCDHALVNRRNSEPGLASGSPFTCERVAAAGQQI